MPRETYFLKSVLKGLSSIVDTSAITNDSARIKGAIEQHLFGKVDVMQPLRVTLSDDLNYVTIDSDLTDAEIRERLRLQNVEGKIKRD